MNIDRRSFIAALGGAVAIETMSSEALADALFEMRTFGETQQHRSVNRVAVSYR